MTRAALVLAFVGGVAGLAALEADEQDEPSFEVASVKVNRSQQPAIMNRPTPGRVDLANAPLTLVIEQAYGIRPGRIVGAPDWLENERFDIVATYDPARRAQVPNMLQSLLRDRFALRAHAETREMPIYELVKAAADGPFGPGLRPSTTNCTPPPGQRSPCTMRIESGEIDAIGARWGFLPPNIGVWDRPIIDKTGLVGSFDVHLKWAPDPAMAGSPEAAAAAAAVSAPGHASIFTALQEQLGLKLEPARGPVEVLVIDSVGRPTPD